MRIEIDFGETATKKALFRGFLLLAPVILMGLALWLWYGPIVETFSPFALAFVFAYLVNPVIKFLAGENRERFKIHRAFAILILILALLSIVVGVFAYVIPAVVHEGVEFAQWVKVKLYPAFENEMKPKADDWLQERGLLFEEGILKEIVGRAVEWHKENRDKLTVESLTQVLTYGYRGAGMVAGGAGGVWSWISNSMGGAVSFFVYLSLLLVIMFYMLLDFAAFKASLIDLLPDAYEDRIVGVLMDVDKSVGGFIRGQMTVSMIVGGLVMISMLVLGVPFAIPIGIAAGLFGFIPYLGPVMGLAPGVILTLLEYFDPALAAQAVTIKLALVVGSFMLIQMAEGFLISPKIMSESVDVSPLVVMGSLMLGGAIAGVTGMVLAIPTYCILRVLVAEYGRELARVGKKA